MSTSYVIIRDQNFGEKRPDIADGIISGYTPVTFRAWNWVPTPYHGTFLYSENDWLGTDNSVTPSISPLDSKYQFIIEKCQSTDPFVNYGDIVNVRNVGSDRIVQCGAGTCSTVTTKSCQDGSWQRMTIESIDGKTGKVTFGDPIRLRQHVGTKCAVTAAGNKTTWCTDGDHTNSYLVILPQNGSVYINPDKENKYYTEKIRDDDFARLDPLGAAGKDALDFLNVGDDILKGIKNIIILVVVLLLAIIVSVVFSVIRRSAKTGGDDSDQQTQAFQSFVL